MKNYMANKTFSRGVETLGAEASMVFVGNTQHTVPYMLKHSDLFDELPEKYHDSAFLDRLHTISPGLGGRDHPRRDVLRRVRVRRRLHRRDARRCAMRITPTVTRSCSRFVRHLHPRPRRRQQDVLRADEDAVSNGQRDRGRSRGNSRLALKSRRADQGSALRIDSTYPETDFSFLRRDGSRSARPRSKRLNTLNYIRCDANSAAMNLRLTRRRRRRRFPSLASPTLRSPCFPATAAGASHFCREPKRREFRDALFGPGWPAQARSSSRIPTLGPSIRREI